MTMKDAIEWADSLRPNDFTQAQKQAWLNDLDGQIFREVILPRTEPCIEDFTPHRELTDTLLVSFPDTGLYPLYLVMCFDLHNGETGKYANSAAAFETAYRSFACHYYCTHGSVLKRGLRF